MPSNNRQRDDEHSTDVARTPLITPEHVTDVGAGHNLKGAATLPDTEAHLKVLAPYIQTAESDNKQKRQACAREPSWEEG